MSEKKVALITGCTGQDGSYLAEQLVHSGWEVHGVVRRASSFNTGRVEHLIQAENQFFWHFGDLTDGASLRHLLEKTKPTHVFNLGAQSHVRVSFDVPEYTADVVGLGCLRLLEAIRDVNKSIRFYQASSSEMFGGARCPRDGYDEQSPFDPRSPYAAAKVFAFHMTRNYREAYGMWTCNGILFNHESPRRGPTFVTRKITRGLARILAGKQKTIALGNLDARRDWGHAADYTHAMRLMLEHDQPDDYVIATGENYSVRDFLEVAFDAVDLDYEKYVTFDERFLRPTEVEELLGNPRKAMDKLGWEPTWTFKGLVYDMLRADFAAEGSNRGI